MEKLLEQYDNKYSVNDTGDVFSLKGSKKKLMGKITKYGYRQLLINHNGVKKYVFEHKIILSSFTDNVENKRTVNHKDGNKLNNCLNNLEWATDSENQLHAIKNKLITHKIDFEIAEKIRNDIGSHRVLAEKYGIGKTQIGYIKNNKRWKIK
jgi:hypothetical protein